MKAEPSRLIPRQPIEHLELLFAASAYSKVSRPLHDVPTMQAQGQLTVWFALSIAGKHVTVT